MGASEGPDLAGVVGAGLGSAGAYGGRVILEFAKGAQFVMDSTSLG
jgi:hypothetical protein